MVNVRGNPLRGFMGSISLSRRASGRRLNSPRAMAPTTSRPPRALRGRKVSPPRVQAKIAAKTGSREKMRETVMGLTCFCAVICMKKADRVGIKARNKMTQAVLAEATPRGAPAAAAAARQAVPAIQNWWKASRIASASART